MERKWNGNGNGNGYGLKTGSVGGNGNGSGTGAGKSDCAVLISDVHIGSNTFLDDAFSNFIDWLRDCPEPVRYLIIAGDIVDGIGVYPGQEQELEIPMYTISTGAQQSISVVSRRGSGS